MAPVPVPPLRRLTEGARTVGCMGALAFALFIDLLHYTDVRCVSTRNALADAEYDSLFFDSATFNPHDEPPKYEHSGGAATPLLTWVLVALFITLNASVGYRGGSTMCLSSRRPRRPVPLWLLQVIVWTRVVVMVPHNTQHMRAREHASHDAWLDAQRAHCSGLSVVYSGLTMAACYAVVVLWDVASAYAKARRAV